MSNFYHISKIPSDGDIIVSHRIYSHHYVINFKSGKSITICFLEENILTREENFDKLLGDI